MNDVTEGPISLDNFKGTSSAENESESESLELPDRPSPKKVLSQQCQADEYLMDSRHVSYILIDSKNYQSGHLPNELMNLNPFAAGFEPNSTTVADPYCSHIWLLPCITIERRSITSRSCALIKRDTTNRIILHPLPCTMLIWTFRTLPANSPNFYDRLMEIHLALEGEDRLIKCLQKFGVKGTKMPQEAMSFADIGAGSSVSVTSEPSRKRVKR